ncbi:hypothetical protein MAR_037689 [Mya arenaria]|uniref:Uncharacterized protein n=1 Tax=Mya arenaria TaxID=6604 RepID=A0ABY7FP73_MYAAR|nr:hypothetical protein MAR_037689 [Mya arenaria]
MESADARQNGRGNYVPVVSVQYDVPMSPPSPLMYRIRRLGTPQMLGYTRSKSEERVRVNNQIAVSVDSHRLKGMGVGKIYSDYPYHPPPTAPEQNPHHVRPIATPSSSMLANSTFSRSSAHSISQTSPLSNYQTASPSRPERAVLKSAQNTRK